MALDIFRAAMPQPPSSGIRQPSAWALRRELEALRVPEGRNAIAATTSHSDTGAAVRQTF